MVSFYTFSTFGTFPLQVEEPPVVSTGIEPTRLIMDAIATAFSAFIAGEVYPGTFPEETGRIIPNCFFDAPVTGGLDVLYCEDGGHCGGEGGGTV